MKTNLIACPACQRHVKAQEATCIFCGEAMPRGGPALEPRGRVSRSALVALSTSVVAAGALALEGCGGDAAGPIVPSDAGRDGQVADASDGGPAALYGGPPISDGGAWDGGGPVPVYGAPAPPPDAGSNDGGDGGGTNTGALYGGPPVSDAGPDGSDGGGVITPAYGGPPSTSGGG